MKAAEAREGLTMIMDPMLDDFFFFFFFFFFSLFYPSPVGK